MGFLFKNKGVSSATLSVKIASNKYITLYNLKVTHAMKDKLLIARVLLMISLFIGLISCDDEDDSVILIPSSEFVLPDACKWDYNLFDNNEIEQEKVYRIDSQERLDYFVMGEEDAQLFDVDFEKEMLLYVFMITLPVESIEVRLIQNEEKESTYTFQVNIRNYTGSVANIAIGRYLVLKTKKIPETIAIELEVNES